MCYERVTLCDMEREGGKNMEKKYDIYGHPLIKKLDTYDNGGRCTEKH